MSKFTAMTEELHRYVVEHGAPEDEVLRRVRAETAAMGDISAMQVAPEEGALLGLLVRLSGARRVIELGTFTGYSAICMARALPPDGVLIGCELSQEFAEAARRNLDDAGVGDRVELRVGPALETLARLEPGSIDLAFVDAEKSEYPDYWRALVPAVRAGGLIAVDNVLWSGAVIEPADTSERTAAIRELNRTIAADGRVEHAMVGVADGLTLAVVRPRGRR